MRAASGGDCVREEALEEIADWMQNGSHKGAIKPVPGVDI